MSSFPIDIDAEAIYLDGSWYTREDLARRIKGMLDAGDFSISRPSAALEALTQTVSGVRTLAFRCTPDLADALNQYATRTGTSVGQVLRDAVTALLTQGLAQQEPQRSVREETVKAAAPTPPEAHPPHELQPAPPVLMPGPGALRAAGVMPDSHEQVTIDARRDDEPASPAEQRWFKQ
jgi:hypothetical protein